MQTFCYHMLEFQYKTLDSFVDDLDQVLICLFQNILDVYSCIRRKYFQKYRVQLMYLQSFNN